METVEDIKEEIDMEELEEGELSDGSDGSDNGYTPLERPENFSNIKNDSRFTQMPIVQDSESDEKVSTDDDSDSDTNVNKIKKPKIKLKVKPLQNLIKKKKYDIWSTRVQEDVLSETLNTCDVTKKDRSRDVESYDYVTSERYLKMINGTLNNKRTMNDRNNIHHRLAKRTNDHEDNPREGTKRDILELSTTLDNSVEEIAKDMSNKLFEEKVDLITNIINIIGKQKCFDIFEETRVIEANGGMLIMNQSRRRTPGGVFLYLIRGDESITKEQKNEVFNDEKKNYKTKMLAKRRKKLQKIKQETAEERSKLFPQLLLKKTENKFLKEDIETDVVNPPPTPETDGHENSCDGVVNNIEHKFENRKNEVTSYDDDFLDISCSNNDMELF